MKYTLRIMDSLLDGVRADLRRPHSFAAERVGFMVCKFASSENDSTMLAFDYIAVADDTYIDDHRFGALVSSAGFLPALQRTLTEKVSICHVHLHDHSGRVRFSRPDEQETARFMPDFLKVRADAPHCALVVGKEHIWGRCWSDRARPGTVIDAIHVVGAPLITSGADYD
jgi:hypothetical protein